MDETQDRRSMSQIMQDEVDSIDAAEGPPLLVVAAFWAMPGEDNELQPLVDRRVQGSGSVVTFTPEQAAQPGLLAGLRKYQLSEAADYQPSVIDDPDTDGGMDGIDGY